MVKKVSEKEKNSPVKNFFRAVFVRNFKYKLLAFGVAALLWVVIAGL